MISLPPCFYLSDNEPLLQVSPMADQCPASADSPLRRCWDEEPFMPGFGPPSMTQVGSRPYECEWEFMVNMGYHLIHVCVVVSCT